MTGRRAMARYRIRRFGVAVSVVAVLATAACGSSKSSSGTNGGSSSTSYKPQPVSTAPGNGVTPTSIKLGVALVDFTQIRQFTDLIRTKQEQQQIYQIYIDNVNKN